MQAELDFVRSRAENSNDRLDGWAALFHAGQLRHHHGCLFIEAKHSGDLCFDLVGAFGGSRTAGRKNIHELRLLE